MLSTSLSLLAFAIVVVGGCWWMDRRGGAPSRSEPTGSEDQTSLAAIATLVALSDTPSCSSDDNSHSACSGHSDL
jgi:hypothetical protein